MSVTAAVLAAVLLWQQVHAATVPPPSNVSLQCGNFRNTVHWVYKDLTPGLRFKVEYGQLFGSPSVPGPLWVDPPDLQADVSFLSDPINDYYVTVAAVVGNDQSDASPHDGLIFTYSQNSAASNKCTLDLPPVKVTEQRDGKVAISFQHPWQFYKEKMPSSFRSRVEQMMEEWPVFNYNVVKQGSDYPFLCEEEVCTGKLSVNSSEKTLCLEITGNLEKIEVRGTREYCVSLTSRHDNSTTIIAVVSALVVFAVAAVVFIVIRKFIHPSSLTPPTSFQRISSGSHKEFMRAPPEEVMDVAVKVDSPEALLTAEELPAAEEPSSSHFICRLPIELQDNHVAVADVSAEGGQRDDDDDDDDDLRQEQPDIPSAYSQKRNMDAIMSGCKNAAGSLDELEPGELVETYRDASDSPRL